MKNQVTATLLSALVLCAACGRSVYTPAANKETDEALREGGIIALNDDDYSTAAEKLGKLWEREPTNDSAQLYAISLLGVSGFSLFDVVKRALTSITDNSAKASSAGNAILDKISAVVGVNVTDAQLDTMRKAITVLEAAPNQSSAGLKFQKCLTAGIYAAPTLGNLTTRIAALNKSLQTLPTRLGAVGSTCNASSSAVNAIGTELTSVISEAASLAVRVKDIESVIGDCLPKDAATSVNAVTKQVTQLTTNADKGCTIPSTQQIGSYTLPSCMNAFVLASGSSTAAAGDKKIAGCEVFLNCGGGNKCF